MATREEARRELARRELARRRGVPVSEVLEQIRQSGPEAKPEPSALSRFSRGAIGAGASLMDLGQTLAGVPGSGSRAMNTATELGITDPSSLTATDLPSTMGRQVPGLAIGGLVRPAAMGAELMSGVGGGVGEFAGQQVGGNVGALAGGLAGSLTGAGLAQGAKSVLQAPGGAQANQALRAATGAPVGLAEVGGSGLTRFIERTAARIPGGSLVARSRATRIGLAVSRRAQAIGDKLTQAVDPELAGEAIREGFGSAKRRFQITSGKLYDKSAALSAGTTRVPARYGAAINQLLKESREGATASSRVWSKERADLAEELAEAFQTDMAAGPQFTMAKMDNIRRRLGEELGDVSMIGTTREGAAKMLYAALTEDMRLLASSAGPKARKAFENANGFYAGNLEKLKRIHKSIINKQTDTEIFNALFTKGQKGPEILRDLRDGPTRIPREQWDMAVGMVLKRMGRETPGATTVTEAGEAGFNLNRFLTNWAKFNDSGTLKVLFEGKSPAMRGVYKDLNHLAKVASGSRELTQVLGNTSNTAEVQLAGTAFLGLFSAGFAPEVAGAIGSGIAASTGLELMLQSPAFINWLATSTRIPVGQLPAHMERLERAIEKEPQARPLAQVIVDGLQP